jgi:restriction system protein
METTINTIPDYQTLMLSLLKLLSDGNPYTSTEATEALAERFGLSQVQREELLPSGTQTIIGNRTGWAKFYLERGYLSPHPLSQNPSRRS